MADAPNFKSLLQRNLDDVKRPEPIPEGSYRGQIRNFTYGASAQKKTPQVDFEIVPTEAMDGVDQDELSVALQGEPLHTKKMRSTFYITDESLFRLKEFLASCGIETQGRTLDETIPETKGMEVLIDVAKLSNKDGTGYFNNITKISGTAS